MNESITESIKFQSIAANYHLFHLVEDNALLLKSRLHHLELLRRVVQQVNCAAA